MGVLGAILVAGQYIVSPIVFVVRVLLTTILTLAAPLIYLGKFTLLACWYPIHLLSKLEDLYIFIGIALIVGALTGTSVHFVSSFFFSILQTREQHPTQAELSNALGRAESIERERARRSDLPFREELDTPSLKHSNGDGSTDWDMIRLEQLSGRRGKIPNTILEEEDSSEAGFD